MPINSAFLDELEEVKAPPLPQDYLFPQPPEKNTPATLSRIRTFSSFIASSLVKIWHSTREAPNLRSCSACSGPTSWGALLAMGKIAIFPWNLWTRLMNLFIISGDLLPPPMMKRYPSVLAKAGRESRKVRQIKRASVLLITSLLSFLKKMHYLKRRPIIIS